MGSWVEYRMAGSVSRLRADLGLKSNTGAGLVINFGTGQFQNCFRDSAGF